MLDLDIVDTFCVGFAGDSFDTAGRLVDEAVARRITAALSALHERLAAQR
jgi:hypothetical protein